ncbi:hypothetical protein R1flu_009203 [Riccia fluitans]|uniref:Uncharacterized protein n=1 Tax=Riccia fluitans TaxID=41844 RepID=A0ABD1Z1E9_9MARC
MEEGNNGVLKEGPQEGTMMQEGGKVQAHHGRYHDAGRVLDHARPRRPCPTTPRPCPTTPNRARPWPDPETT